MFILDDCTLDSLKLAPAYQKILTFHGCIKGKKLLDSIEVYKILTREDLVFKLNEINKDIENPIYILDEDRIYTTSNAISANMFDFTSNIDIQAEYIRDKEQDELPEELAKVCEEFNVMLEVCNDKILVLISITNELDIMKLQLALASYVTKFIWITPQNYREYRNLPEPKREPLLTLRRLALECMKEGGSDLKLNVIYDSRIPKVVVRFRIDETVVDSNLFTDITVQEEETMIKQVIQEHSDISVNEVDTGACAGFLNNLICEPSIESRFGLTKLMVGYYINIRIQALTINNMTVDNLGLDYETVQTLEYAQERVQGITLITGPMKSGKSTTLWGMMGTMLKKPIQCIEYSSPVEAKMELPQIDYNGNVNYLRRLLSVAKKQDINVAFLNEIPDSDIAQGVRDLANSNVHVITTFHLDRIWDLPHKLYEYYGDSYKNILSQINIVVNQKMFVKQCPYCRVEKLAEDTPPIISSFLKANGISTVWENRGCDKCNNGELIGGRIPKAEWLRFDDELIENLRGLSEPRDMEKYLKDLLLHTKSYVERKVALDFKLLDSIKSGELSYRCLYDLKTLGGKLGE